MPRRHHVLSDGAEDVGISWSDLRRPHPTHDADVNVGASAVRCLEYNAVFVRRINLLSPDRGLVDVEGPPCYDVPAVDDDAEEVAAPEAKVLDFNEPRPISRNLRLCDVDLRGKDVLADTGNFSFLIKFDEDVRRDSGLTILVGRPKRRHHRSRHQRRPRGDGTAPRLKRRLPRIRQDRRQSIRLRRPVLNRVTHGGRLVRVNPELTSENFFTVV